MMKLYEILYGIVKNKNIIFILYNIKCKIII
jgi:hypothetical protein